MSRFTANQWQRYQRHIQLDAFGVAGQLRLRQARVLVVGVGGLGCPVAQYLAAAGVGHLTLVDGDEVSRSNLHRQVLFTEADIGLGKAAVAAARLRAMNPELELRVVPEALSIDNAESLIEGCDLVLDCTDNFSARYLINDCCINLRRPWLFASVVRFSGQLALFTPGKACFRCLYPRAPEGVEDCNAAGVLSTLPGMVGLLQANEALKFLAGLECPLDGRLMLVEGLDLQMRHLALQPAPECVCRQGRAPILADDDTGAFTCDTSAAEAGELSPVEFEARRSGDRGLLLDVRSQQEHEAFNLGGDCLPLDEQFIDRARTGLPEKNSPCVLYCQSGRRSARAAQLLRDAGFTRVETLAGGIARWLEVRPDQPV